MRRGIRKMSSNLTFQLAIPVSRLIAQQYDACPSRPLMREDKLAIVVLAHGGWSAAWAWKKVRPLMAAAGHHFFTPTYTGLGERAHLASPSNDLETHIQDLLGVLRFEDLHEREADPSAARMINRGEATVAPRGRADDFSWPRSNTSGDGDMEPTADAVQPRSSGGTSELDEKPGNTMSKPEVVKSGDAKSRQKQSSPNFRQDRQTAPSR
jgi:hypothetical protein